MSDITITLAVRTPPSNPEQNYGLPVIIGPGSSGAFDTLQEARSNADIANVGWGPITHAIAYALLRAGGPVQYVRSRSTSPGAVWGPGLVKEPSGRSVLYVYGRIKLSGADANGDLVWQAKALGVSLQVQTGGALAASVNGKAILLTIPAATTATDVETFWNGADPGAVAAKALADISSEGTGASNAGTTLAATSFDLGTLIYTGIDAGYRVFHKQAGNNTALASAYSTKDLTIDLATDADGTATSTAAAVIANITAGAVGKFTVVAASGSGTGLAGVQSGLTAIPFGSGGTAALSGTVYDRANLVIEITGAGTVGSSPSPVLRWAIDYPRREDGKSFGRGNGMLALVARRHWQTVSGSSLALRAKITQQTGNSKALSHAFDGRTLEILLGTTSGGVPNSTAEEVRDYIVSVSRLRAAFLAYLPSGDGSGVMEAADQVEVTLPAVNWSAPTPVPSNGVVALRNGAVDTGQTLTLSGAFDLGDILAAQLTPPTSSVDDMVTAAAAALADPVKRPAWVAYLSPVSRVQASTLNTQIVNIFDSRPIWAQFQAREWDPETETMAEWRAAVSADFLGSDWQLLEGFAGEHTHVSAYTARAITQPGIVAGVGTAALAPYHQDLGKVRTGPTSGPLPNVTGLWYDEVTDETLTQQRFTCMRTDEDAPGSYFYRLSPSFADPTNVGRNRIQFIRTDLVCAREAKLILRQFRNSPLDYQTTAGSDGSPVGALTPAAAYTVQTAVNAAIELELNRTKRDGERSVSPQSSPYATVLRTNNYFQDRTIYVEVGAAKRPPAEKGRIIVYDRPES